MDAEFWHERWKKGEIGFHSAEVQPALIAYWHRLDLDKSATVFVPLAGKSLDMIWLAAQGRRVVGVELSEIAVQAFFAEQGVRPTTETHEGFRVSSHGGVEIWCGDIFALSSAALPKLCAIYYRAALIALPPQMQPRYVAKLRELLPEGARGLLLGFDYDTRVMDGPPFATPQSRVRELLSDAFDIQVLDVKEGPPKSPNLREKGLSRIEEAVYRLERRAGARS